MRHCWRDQLAQSSGFFISLWLWSPLQKPLARFLRACLILPVFVGCFVGRAHDGAGIQKAYSYMVKLLGCAILFFFANVLRTLVAKMMSTHFHKEAHFKKMQEALQKVCCIPLDIASNAGRRQYS